MRHNFWGNTPLFGDGIFGFLVITLIVIIIIAIFNFIKNKIPKEKELTISQKEIFDNFEALTLAMLNQQGSALTQQEIGLNLKLPIELVSEKLNQMEKEKKVLREWINEEYTYKVILV